LFKDSGPFTTVTQPAVEHHCGTVHKRLAQESNEARGHVITRRKASIAQARWKKPA